VGHILKSANAEKVFQLVCWSRAYVLTDERTKQDWRVLCTSYCIFSTEHSLVFREHLCDSAQLQQHHTDQDDLAPLWSTGGIRILLLDSCAARRRGRFVSKIVGRKINLLAKR